MEGFMVMRVQKTSKEIYLRSPIVSSMGVRVSLHHRPNSDSELEREGSWLQRCTLASSLSLLFKSSGQAVQQRDYRLLQCASESAYGTFNTR